MGHDFTAAYWQADLLRIFLIAALLLLAVLSLRAGWIRRHEPPEHAPHLFMYLANAVTLLYLAVARLIDIGEPPMWESYGCLLIVALNAYGLLIRNRMAPMRPSTRRDAERY